jgi:hypothetical protein
VATFADIRAGLVAAITAAIDDVQCAGYVLASPTPPFIEFELADDGVEYSQAANNGAETWNVLVRAVVANTLDIGAQQKMDALIGTGTGTIKSAIEADLTLGGVCDSLRVVSNTRPAMFPPTSGETTAWWGAEWRVEVLV